MPSERVMPNRLYLSFRERDRATARIVARRWRIVYGRFNVIMDAQNDRPERYAIERHIEDLMSDATHVFIVIGQQWSGLDDYGRYRLSTADVPIQPEIKTALYSNLPTTLLLVDEVNCLPGDIPEDLRGLSQLPTATLRPGHVWEDLDALVPRPTIGQWLRYLLMSDWLITR